MNQRVRRARDRKNDMTISTGGQLAHHGRGTDPIVRVPQKATGNLPEPKEVAGLAKASPFFKKMDEVVKPASKEAEKKIIAASKIEPKKTEEKGDETGVKGDETH